MNSDIRGLAHAARLLRRMANSESGRAMREVLTIRQERPAFADEIGLIVMKGIEARPGEAAPL